MVSLKRIGAASLVLLAAVPPPSAAQDRENARPRPALFSEPRPMATGLDFAGRYLSDEDGDEPAARSGFYPVFGGMVTGAGWISLGSGYRRTLFGNRALFDTSAAVSWRGYKRAQARFEATNLANRRVVAGAQILWQDLTQLQYFGRGNDSLKASRSDYRLKATDFVGYATYRPAEWLSVGVRLGRLTAPSISSSSGPFDRDFPDAFTTFGEEPAFGLPEQPGFVHGELSVTADTRDNPGHPRRGGMYRVAWSRYADRDLDAFTFDRYEMEAVRAVPVQPDFWTLAFHGWAAFSATADGQQIPVYMLSGLGGSNSLRSFADYRFHDRHLLLASAESRWALFPRLDAAFFVDAGGVAPRVADLSLDHMSYGAGVRLHMQGSTVARLDVATGREGWRLLFRLNEPFRPSRLSRRTAAVPFVP